MNKMREYERGREDGLDLALRIVRQGGIEALEKEVRFRNITGVHTSLAVKDLGKASEQDVYKRQCRNGTEAGRLSDQRLGSVEPERLQ